MRKILLTFTLSFVYYLGLNAQELVSSSGNNYTNSKGTIHYSVGELMVETFINSSNYVTQGFHQSKLTVTSISELNNDEVSISVYPNPTSDNLKLIVNSVNLDNNRFELYDISGSKILHGKIRNAETILKLSNLKSSIYILKIFKEEKEINSYKIIKQ